MIFLVVQLCDGVGAAVLTRVGAQAWVSQTRVISPNVGQLHFADPDVTIVRIHLDARPLGCAVRIL